MMVEVSLIFIYIVFCTDTFWTNPQYRVTLTDPDDDDDDDLCTILVGVLQKDRRKKRKEGLDMLTIGYVIYKVWQNGLNILWQDFGSSFV